jgi:hypothetical protein
VKLKEYKSPDEKSSAWVFFCLPCGRSHPYSVPRWTFNGDVERPTFTPSLRILDGNNGTACHVNITDGKIIYHGDCPHSYANKVIDLPDVDEEKLS